jgi:hypothetical protein
MREGKRTSSRRAVAELAGANGDRRVLGQPCAVHALAELEAL